MSSGNCLTIRKLSAVWRLERIVDGRVKEIEAMPPVWHQERMKNKGPADPVFVAQVRASLIYNPSTGVLTWLINSGKARIGNRAGSPHPIRGRQIRVASVQTTAARIIWLIVHGEWPSVPLEHANGDELDDRLANLRLLSTSVRGQITQDRLKQLYTYNPFTGEFVRNQGNRHRLKCGTTRPSGYIYMWVDGHAYQAHRLAWLYVYGVWPPHLIDHINGVRADNRIENLREADWFQNAANARKPKSNTSGYKGVQWHKVCSKWTARIKHNNKTYHIGLYDTREEAYEAYCKRARELKGDYARVD